MLLYYFYHFGFVVVVVWFFFNLFFNLLTGKRNLHFGLEGFLFIYSVC